MKKIDLIDYKILELFKENSRSSHSQISMKIGKTEATIWKSFNKLIKDGIIKKYNIEYALKPIPKIITVLKIQPDFRKIKEIKHIWRLIGNSGLIKNYGNNK